MGMQQDTSFLPAESDFEEKKKVDYDKYVNYYKILGLPHQAASSKMIGEHYQMLDGLMRIGFDLIKKDEAGRKPAKEELATAFAVLSHQPTRRQYDRDRDYMKAYSEISGIKQTPDKDSLDGKEIMTKMTGGVRPGASKVLPEAEKQ